MPKKRKLPPSEKTAQRLALPGSRITPSPPGGVADILVSFNEYIERRLAQNPQEAVEDIETELLGGNMFDPDEPYVVGLARLALDELGFEIE